MTAEVLIPKLDSLARCLLRIEGKKPFTVQQLNSDADLQDVISVNLERAVQQCVDIASMVLAEQNTPAPATMAESFAVLATLGWIAPETARALEKAVGFRNISVHEYEKMDWAIAHAVCHRGLDDLRRFGREVSARAGLTKG